MVMGAGPMKELIMKILYIASVFHLFHNLEKALLQDNMEKITGHPKWL